MKNSLFIVFAFLLFLPKAIFAQAGSCVPLAGTSNLAKTPRPLKDVLGINAGFEVERFNAQYNSPVPLADLDSVCSFVRFFYQQNKDYLDAQIINGVAQNIQLYPRDFNFTGKTRGELINNFEYFFHNHNRIEQIKAAGLKVNVALEITDFYSFPNKWWAIGDLTSNPSNPSTVQIKGAEWADAFLRVYDPKDASGNYQLPEPLVATLELGNEPWGYPGTEAYRYYIRGILDAFKTYYGTNVNNHRIKLAGAAFQAHELLGTTMSWVPGGHLLDYVGTMLGGSELSELRGYLTEGVGVHNYNFESYCYNDVSTIKKHPEKADGGFSFYKNMSEWVNGNMPAGNTKLNATEFGWNSDDEPSKKFEVNNYSNVIGINYPGCNFDDFGNCTSSNYMKLGIGRTAQAAYLVRSILILNRWGANQVVAYNLLDDWGNGAYFSNGLMDGTSPQNYSQFQQYGDAINPVKRKESWYAIKKLNEALGEKYFLQQYGSEADGGVYCYLYGTKIGTSSEATPTHLVVWRAKQIDPTTIPGVENNNNNNNNNINTVRNNTVSQNFASLALPAGITINTAGMATYLDGHTTLSQVNVSGIYSGGNITVSPIPLVIPISVNGGCTINYNTGIVSNCSGGGGCTITSIGATTQCSDNGTPSNPADDTYTISLNPTGTGTGAQYSVTVNGGSPATYNYGSSQPIAGTHPISGGPSTVVVTNVGSSCSLTGTVSPPSTCSNGGNPITISNCPGSITLTAGPNGTAVLAWTDPTATTTCTGGGSCSTVSGYAAPTTLNGRGYYLSTATQPWQTAVTKCGTDIPGGTLAMAKDNATEDHIKLLLSNNSLGEAFIGLSDAAAEAQYKWVDNTSYPGAVNGNSAANDFAYIATWAADPYMVDEFVHKRYVCEVACGGGGNGLAINQTGGTTKGTVVSPGTYNIVYTATDACGNSNTCIFTVTVLPYGGGCTITSIGATTQCSDNGTPSNPADDTYTISLNPTGTGTGAQYSVTVNGGSPATYNYGSSQPIAGTHPISGGPSTVVVTNVGSSCSLTGTVSPPSTCSNGGNPDCNAITITPGTGTITIAGFSAPHVLIKVFRPDWTVAFECLDGACANPQVVPGLSTGSHFVEVKLFDASWGLICTKPQTVGVNNLVRQDNRMRLNFDKFYPNPTAYLTNIELYSPVEQGATLDFYDRTGRLVHTMEVQLEKGQNLIEQLVFDWKSGTYNVVARGEKSALPAYGRFLKVWEE